jgi:hypothetical protein
MLSELAYIVECVWVGEWLILKEVASLCAEDETFLCHCWLLDLGEPDERCVGHGS